MRCPTVGYLLLSFVVIIAWPSRDARASDTVETYLVRRSYAELYLYHGGLGRYRLDRSASALWLGGYGIVPALSVYVGAQLEPAAFDLQGGLWLGVFGTPVDTRHFDLDLGVDVGGPGPTQLQITPSLELNFDAEDDLAGWGVYARVELPIYDLGPQRGGVHPARWAPVMDLDLTVGTYIALAPGHQLLLEHALSIPAGSVPLSGLALGYNVVVSEAFELLTEVSLALPQGPDEPAGVGVMFGFVATLPATPNR